MESTTPPDDDLTPRQREVLALVRAGAAAGRVPTLRELADATGVTPATVSDFLRYLERAGYVRRTGRHRGVELTGKAGPPPDPRAALAEEIAAFVQRMADNPPYIGCDPVIRYVARAIRERFGVEGKGYG